MIRKAFLIVGILLGAASASLAQSPTATVRPDNVRAGENFTLMVTVDGCPQDATRVDLLDKEKSVNPSGSDITLSNPVLSNCSLTFTGLAASKPTNRTVTIVVVDKNAAPRILATKTIEILDNPPGPIPPGLAPQVDVMWDIMSKSTCSDQFGKRVSSRYFCIDILIGNNSGYPILLAGVGFMRRVGDMKYRESAASYLSARAVLQHEQVMSWRNVTLRGLQATGVLIGAFAPFSGSAGRKGRIGLWSSIVGNTVAGAFDSIYPDLTVRQAGNLDDAALRDGKIIPNNSPARFTVFVGRDSVKDLLLRLPSQLKADANLSKAKADRAHVRAIDPGEPDRTAMVKEWEAETQLADSLTALAAFTSNSKNLKTKSKGMDIFSRESAPLEDNLIAVRYALGSLIIVGDQIEFKQRVQVDSNAVNPAAKLPAAPAIGGSVTTNPNPPVRGAPFSFIINGTNFDPNTVFVSIVGPGCAPNCTIANTALPVKTASQITGSTVLSSDGSFTLTVQNASGGAPSTSVPLTVVPATPTVTGTILTDPAQPVKATQFIFTINGSDFDPKLVFVNISGPGCSPCQVTNNLLSTVSPSLIKGNFIPPKDGTFTVTVQNGPAGSPSTGLTLVVKPVTPAFTNLTTAPAPPVHGTEFSFTITGSNIDTNIIAVNFAGPGCTKTAPCTPAVTQKTDKLMVGTITIPAVGDYTVTIQNGGGDPSAGRPLKIN